jgi:uncharacterized protein
MRVLLSAIAACLLLAAPASAASTTLVINEVDYDQASTDTAEFLEIKNVATSAINLDAYSLRFVNGANGSTYLTVDLPDVDLAGGDHYVVCSNLATTANCDLDGGADTNLIQNGNPDGVVIELGTTVVDGLAYGPGTTMTGVAEGAHATTDTDTAGRGIARVPDGCDTDSNVDDFQRDDITPGASNGEPACGGPPVDAAPAVADTSPDSGATQVPLDANVSITFSEAVNLAGDAVAISCSQSGAHAATRSGGPETFTFDPEADFVRNEVCTVTVSAAGVTDQDADDPPDGMAADFSFSFSTLGLALRIREIQGTHHLSTHDGDFVAGVPGVITAKHNDGFFIQDPTSDGDERSSEGIFVFTGVNSRPDVPVGMSAEVNGLVDEFRPGSATGNNLTITEITRATWTIGAPGTVQPTVLGIGGRLAPIFVIDNDADEGNAEDPDTPFDPRHDGLDFHESVEGMLVRINNPLVVGPTNGFDELPVVADFGLLAFPHTLRGGVFVRPDDFNPERIVLDAEVGFATPDAHVRDRLDSVNAVAHYSFGAFKYNVTSTPGVKPGGLEREVTQAPGRNELAVGSMNVENLDPTDPPEKFEELASILVNNMKSPDIVALEEVQDNNGAAPGDTDASLTYAEFIAAIEAVGGPTYDFRQINPAPGNPDGGEPNGNIRVGFLFRTDRGLAFVDRPGGTATTPTEVVDTPSGPQLTFSPGRIDPNNPAFAISRKPLAAEFTWKGRTVFAVANHFNSKGGDDPLFGRFQPPRRVTEEQRHQQATVVADFAADILAADKHANVIVGGDLNDFEFSETLDILEDDGGLFNLMETLPVWERYSYVFEGNSQTLDQILVSKALMSPKPEYDSVHVNAEFHDQASDHDPQVARLRPN